MYALTNAFDTCVVVIVASCEFDASTFLIVKNEPTTRLDSGTPFTVAVKYVLFVDSAYAVT